MVLYIGKHRLRETSAIRMGITGVAISFQMAEEGSCDK